MYIVCLDDFFFGFWVGGNMCHDPSERHIIRETTKPKKNWDFQRTLSSSSSSFIFLSVQQNIIDIGMFAGFYYARILLIMMIRWPQQNSRRCKKYISCIFSRAQFKWLNWTVLLSCCWWLKRPANKNQEKSYSFDEFPFLLLAHPVVALFSFLVICSHLLLVYSTKVDSKWSNFDKDSYGFPLEKTFDFTVQCHFNKIERRRMKIRNGNPY